MITGIILAGGLSTRLNTNKLVLTVKGKPLIRYAIEGMKPYVDKIIVVTGKYHDELLPWTKDVIVVRNDHYEDGMFSSVLTGVEHVDGDFFILPGDISFVSKKTYEALLHGSFSIRVPAHEGKNGHPVFFLKENKEKILAMPKKKNLKEYLLEKGFEKIEVDDPNILKDVDTPKDYEELLSIM